MVSKFHCWFCNYHIESSDLLFLDCWWPKVFWRYLNLEEVTQQCRDDDISGWLWENIMNLNVETVTLLLYGLYMIWFCRNSLAHGKECFEVQYAAYSTKNRVCNILHPEFKFTVNVDEAELCWRVPAENFIKINCDASWFQSFKNAGIACVARNCEGNNIIGVTAWSIGKTSSFTEAQGHAMKWAENEGWHECVFETDSAEIYKMLLCGNAALISGMEIVNNNAWKFLYNTNWRVALIKMETNDLADKLAKSANQYQWPIFCSPQLPACMQI